MKNPKKAPKKKIIKNEYIFRDLEDKMITKFGSKVTINPRSEKKGKIEIEYYSPEELEHIFDMIMSIDSEETSKENQ